MGEMADWQIGNIVDGFSNGYDDDYEPLEPARFVEIEAEVLVRWKKALLVKVEGSEPEWVPFSLISKSSDLDSKSRIGDKGFIVIPYWLAEKKGWV